MRPNIRKIYHQDNIARKFYLDTELAKYNQGDKIVQEYLNEFLTFWNGKDSMTVDFVPKESKSQVTDIERISYKSVSNELLEN